MLSKTRLILFLSKVYAQLSNWLYKKTSLLSETYVFKKYTAIISFFQPTLFFCNNFQYHFIL